MKRVTRLMSLLLTIALLLGCGGSSPMVLPVVSAATPSTASTTCRDVNTELDDGSGLLKLEWLCTVTASGTTSVSAPLSSYTLTLSHAMSSKNVFNWIGTSAQSQIEIGVSLLITLPDGRQRYFSSEYDKDNEALPGQIMQQWNLPLTLPAGTNFKLVAAPGITNPSTDCPLGCQFETTWVLNDSL